MPIYDIYMNGFLKTAEVKKVLKPNIVKYCKIKTTFLNMRTLYRYEEAVEQTAFIHSTSTRTVKRAVKAVSK